MLFLIVTEAEIERKRRVYEEGLMKEEDKAITQTSFFKSVLQNNSEENYE